jgi:hypothetical protein
LQQISAKLNRDFHLLSLSRCAGTLESRPKLKAKSINNLFARTSDRAFPNSLTAQLLRDNDAAIPRFLKGFRARL